MFPIASSVLALLNENQPQILRITGTDTNGASISITDADVMQGGFEIDRFSCSSQKLELGTACCAEMRLKLNNFGGRFDDVAFEGAELKVEVGVEVQGANEPFWISCGYFIVDEQERKANIITLSALDRMVMAEFEPPQLVPWTDDSDNFMTDNSGNVLYFNVGMAFPATVKDVVDQVCRITGLTLGTDISSFPNASYTISTAPAVPGGTTFRDYLKWAAALMGKCAYIDWRGLLCFGWYEGADYTSDPSTRFSSDLYENDLVITGITYTDDDDNLYVAGTQAYAIDISGNRLVGSNPQGAIAAIYNAVGGFTYRPVSASIMPAPYLWPLDMIAFVDKEGVSHEAALTNVNLTINASTEIQSRGETEKTNSYKRPSGMTLEQAIAMQRAQKAAGDAVNALDLALTQQEIFDRLTDGGLEQGLALESTTNPGPSAAGDKKLFLNLDYARFGKLVADFIQGGTLKLGGLDNVNGELQIVDANGVVIGTWNKDGISVKAGSILANAISGGTLTLGGAVNTNGQMEILDENGNQIGVWDNEKLRLGEAWNYVQLYGPAEYNGVTAVTPFYAVQTYNGGSPFEMMLKEAMLVLLRGSSGLQLNPDSIAITEDKGNGYEADLEIAADYIAALMGGTFTIQVDNGVLDFVANGLSINGTAGASGTFRTADNKTVTVTNGLITRIA